MICPYCGQEAEWVENKEVYGKNYGKSFMIWLCRKCDAYVGVHQNDPDRPLGTMADRELRKWRIKAHAVIDPMWQNKLKTRKEVYLMLQNAFGKEIHIGEADINTCKAIIEFIRGLSL